MATVLIVGCGYVGTALGLRLAADGQRVVGWRRTSGMPSPIEFEMADVQSRDGIPAFPRDLHTLLYMVGATETSDAAYRAAYVDGVRHVIDALRARHIPLQRFIFVSSTGVYSQEHGEWVDEDSPAEAARFTGARLLEGEALVMESGLPHTVVRFAGIYGPGRTRLIDSVREGAAVCPPKPTYVNLIHRDDCAGVLQHLMDLRDPAPVYLGVDHEPVDRAALLRWIAAQLQVSEPPAGDVVSRVGGNKRCRNQRLVESGYRFLYPTYRDGYRDLL